MTGFAMTPNVYQLAVKRTMLPPSEQTNAEALANFALGLAGEAGEVADLLKKVLFHEHPLQADKLKKELGDVLWYVTALAETCGFRLEEIMELNIAKLMARYPNGFSPEASKARVDEVGS